MTTAQKIHASISKNNSLVCVGLDPEVGKVNSKTFFEFNRSVIEQTADLVCAYKPNIAFYEAEGINGLEELKKTIDFLKKSYPDIPIVLDAKRADVPNTAKQYAKALFDYWDCDASTVYPNLGKDSVTPFLEYKDKLTILLIKTSNPDSPTFQNINTTSGPYYMQMAKEIAKWKEDNFGIFVGATYPKELSEMRKLFPDKIFLSAGIGAQSAEVKEAISAGVDKSGAGIIFNASRSIIYDQNPRLAAQKLRDEINKYR